MARVKKSRGASRRGLTKDERARFAKQIIDGYHVSDGCPPLSSHWGGFDLRETDWLKRFAEQVSDDENHSFEAWNTVKEKCDTSFIIELLYLLTLRGKHGVERNRDAYHALLREIEKVIAKYDKLQDDIRRLIQNRQFASPMAFVSRDLVGELQTLQASRQRLEALRLSNKKWGSYKRSTRDWYLLLLAKEVIEGTGSSHIGALASLIDSSRIAHGDNSDEVTDKDLLTKRIQRWMKFLNAKVIGGRMMFRFGSQNAGAEAESNDEPIPF